MTIKREELETFLELNGFVRDRYGHYKKSGLGGRLYRYKLSSIAARKEVRVEHADGSKVWVRLRSGYYGDLSIITGKLSGLQG